MASDTFTLASEIAVLLAGRDPSWVKLTAGITLPPTTGTAGVPMLDSPSAQVHTSLREDAAGRTVKISIGTFVASAGNYTTTINGTAVVTAAGGGDDEATVLAAIAADIDADGTVGPIVNASVVGTEVVIIGVGVDFYLDSFTTTSSSTGLAAVGDYISATAHVWALMTAADGITAPGPWAQHFSDTVTSRGWSDRFHTGGWSRLHVELASLAGHASDWASMTYRAPDVWVGPAVTS